MEPPSRSSCPERIARLSVTGLTFADNGPYTLSCSGAETLGLSGMSGIGKTRFLRALADLDSHGGRISLDGRDCSAIAAPSWRSRVALIPAESRWWYQDVRSHMTADRSADELVSLLELLGFGPDVLDWQVSRLSGGEKQRLAVARVLVRKPAVLLLDELGCSLDRETGLLLERVISMYQKRHDSPVLWVSHNREQMLRVSDCLAVLHRNYLEEQPHPGRS